MKTMMEDMADIHLGRCEQGDGVARRLLLTAKLLYQNAVGCAVNHYPGDFEHQGLPGWLADSLKDIEAFEVALSALPVAPTVEPGAVSPSDPMSILAGIKQFGLAPDGADLRDLEAAIQRLVPTPKAPDPSPSLEAAAREFWLNYDIQAGLWCVEQHPPKVVRSGSEVIHVREVAEGDRTNGQ